MAGSFASAFAMAGTFACVSTFAFAVFGAFAGTVFGAFAISLAVASESVTILIALIIVLFSTVFNICIGRRALDGDPRAKIICDLAVGLAALGGDPHPDLRCAPATLVLVCVP